MQVMTEKDSYLTALEEFEQTEAAEVPAWLRRLRKTAAMRFDKLGFPGPRNEDWRFTSVAPLLQVPFRLAPPAAGGVEAATLAPHTFADSVQLVFVNGRFAPGLSSLAHLPEGVAVTSLARALRERPAALEPHLARHARHDEQPFIALNTAFLWDGAFLSVGQEVILERPVHLVFVSTSAAEPVMSFPRALVVAEAGSRLTLVQSFLGQEKDVYFSNSVTEVVVGDGAVVDHYKLVRESLTGFHVGALQVALGQRSKFTSHFITLGGGWVRNEARAIFAGENAECTLNGLYLASGKQHIDNHTVIDHAKPRCASHELYKGILDGQAHGVFNGKIYVRPDAQKTDAKQTNQTLLLSDDAIIDTKPQLEIFADDVKCTHGATVGQLDADSIFYLRSRGIDRETARALLTYAFANDIVQRIAIEPVRARLEEGLLARQQLPPAEAAQEDV
jgi:Fe-S cluster assembly protein SufD